MTAMFRAGAARLSLEPPLGLPMVGFVRQPWRGRVYAVRYFLLFISAGAAIGMISVLHESGGFALVLGVNAVIALLLFFATLALVAMIISVEGKHSAAQQPAE